MLIRHYAAQYLRNFFPKVHEAARTAGHVDFLRHLKTPPDLGLEPPMLKELPRPQSAIPPSGATTDGKRPAIMRTPINENQ
ncbi:MAG: hypothetical protein PHV13_02545 [Candidatus ainarchaeum sp.]|nr:hypothetical protein [Candidatus ainarchaeum sp.]